MPSYQVQNLSDAKNLADFNKYLENYNYVEGWVPSQADVDAFTQLSAAPEATKFPHVNRWWNHINFFSESEKKSWPGVSKGASTAASAKKAEAKPAKKEEKKAEEEEIDLFGEEEEDDEAHEQEIMRRAKELEEKKKASGKEKPVLKSAVVIDVKPWEDSTDLKYVEDQIRSLTIEGLEWKASKLIPIGYGIKKLAISCHVVDEIVSIDDVQEKIQDLLPDHVQSTDIQSFTKL